MQPLITVLALFLVLIPTCFAEQAANEGFPQTPSELFEHTAVRELHLSFGADDWETMEPRDNGRARGFGRGSQAAPSNRLAPAILHYGKADANGMLSPQAFKTLSAKWFKEWDTNGNMAIGKQELNNAYATVAPEPQGGMNLQGPEGGRNGIAAAFGIEYVYVSADLELDGQSVKNVGVRYKGGGTFLQSRDSIKRPLKVSVNKYVKGQKLAKVTTLNLANGITDASFMNEVLAHRLYRDAGVTSPRTSYARVYITVPNKYDRKFFGLYSIVENVDKHFAKDALGAEGGAIFKPVTPNLFAYLGQGWKHYKQTYDPKGNPSEEQLRRMIELCRFVTYAEDAEFAEKIGDFIDVDNLARYMATMVYLSDFDGILGPGQNFYMHLHPKTNKFSFIPWDQDRSFGQFRGTQEQREQLSIHRPWRGNVRFLERVFEVEAFKERYLAFLDEFSKTIFEPQRFADQIDTVATAIRPVVKEESAELLERFDKVVAGETTQPTERGRRFGGSPSKPVKPFVHARTQSILDQLSGASKGVSFGADGRGGFRRRGEPAGRSPSEALFASLDEDGNGTLTSDEFSNGFNNWYEKWNADQTDELTEEELRAGIDSMLSSSAS